MNPMPAKPLKDKVIAFFHHSSDLYGADRVLLDLAVGAFEYGAQPVVLLPDTGLLTQALSEHGIEFHTAPMLKISRATLGFKGIVQLLWAIRRTLASYDKIFAGRRVDLVHSNTLAVLGGALWASSRGVPHLWHVHEIIEHPRIAARALPLLVRIYADKVVCNSKATYDWLNRMEAHLAGRMRVIWNGMHEPPSQIVDGNDNALYQSLRPAGAALAVGLVGRINRWKGHALLLEASELLHAKGLGNFSLVFIGSPPPGQEHFQRELELRILRSPMADRVLLRGFDTNIWPVYAGLDIVCVPSTDPEPFGLVAIEAMAMGRPVVASRFGGVAEIVVDGVTGVTFPPCQVNALAEALTLLLGDEKMRARMGNAGRARFAAEFTLAPMKQAFASVYAQTMEPRHES